MAEESQVQVRFRLLYFLSKIPPESACREASLHCFIYLPSIQVDVGQLVEEYSTTWAFFITYQKIKRSFHIISGIDKSVNAPRVTCCLEQVFDCLRIILSHLVVIS